MRTSRSLPRLLPRRERTILLATPAESVCVSRRLLVACSRPAACVTAGRRRKSKCGLVRSCAVAAAERHHTLFRSELGYRTDFGEQYSLLEIIGKGNFGTVWLAASRHDPAQHVAVKVISKSRDDRTHEDSIECIKREVAMWGSLSGDSRFVAQLLGLYEDGSSVYLVQQLCQGGDLSSAIKEGPLPEACCSAIMWCVLSAIRDCHDHHLALMDVKPQNFLLTASATVAQGGCPVTQLRLEDQVAGASGGPCVVACDFGCSLSYSELMRGAKRAGSPVFFAPEQFSCNYGLGVDVWAAGVMLYLLLSGRYPFWECKRDELDSKLPSYQVMLAVCSAPISFGGPEWRCISREARDLVGSMLDRNPGTRLTAEQALQHPWFVKWMRPAAAAKGLEQQQQQGQQQRQQRGGGRGRVEVAAAAEASSAGCCSSDGGAGAAAALCCSGSNIVPLVTSPSFVVTSQLGAAGGGGVTAAAGAAAGPAAAAGAAVLEEEDELSAVSDDETAGCSIAHYH